MRARPMLCCPIASISSSRWLGEGEVILGRLSAKEPRGPQSKAVGRISTARLNESARAEVIPLPTEQAASCGFRSALRTWVLIAAIFIRSLHQPEAPRQPHVDLWNIG